MAHNEYKRSKTEELNTDINQYISDSSSFNQNLANVISGLNHEVAPWLGGSRNILTRILSDLDRHSTSTNPEIQKLCRRIAPKLNNVLGALTQATDVLKTVSNNVKLLKNHSVHKRSLLDTVRSWFTVIFLNETIKKAIDQSQIHVNEESLRFEVPHSPMLLSQVFLNLIKNSIEHNPTILPQLIVKIYGRENALIIEDNGKGVAEEFLSDLFTAQATTKADGDIHGLGLTLCKEYCHLMGATISPELVKPHGLRMCIRFRSSKQ